MKYIHGFLFCLIFVSSVSAIAAGTKHPTQLDSKPKQLSSQKMQGSQSGCTCTALIACEAATCAGELFGTACITSAGRANAICLCKNGPGMSRCTNWDEIFNDSSCSQQKNDIHTNPCDD